MFLFYVQQHRNLVFISAQCRNGLDIFLKDLYRRLKLVTDVSDKLSFSEEPNKPCIQGLKNKLIHGRSGVRKY